MGWRFRRSLRVMPGVRLNISKRGLSSLSIGRRGLTLNVGRKGTKETIGLPGTGVSYTTPLHHRPAADTHGASGTTVGWLPVLIIVAAIVAGVFAVIR